MVPGKVAPIFQAVWCSCLKALSTAFPIVSFSFVLGEDFFPCQVMGSHNRELPLPLNQMFGSVCTNLRDPVQYFCVSFISAAF